MDREKIAAFYDDEVKVACEKYCLDKAFYLRAMSTESALSWRARRAAKFLAHLGKGTLRRAGARLAVKPRAGAGAQQRGVTSLQVCFAGTGYKLRCPHAPSAKASPSLGVPDVDTR